MQVHIQYLRSMEDSERTRSACIRYVRTWLPEFYPYRIDIARELKALAAGLGGEVEDPRLSWKYNWIVRLFGWGAGRRVQLTLPRLKASGFFAWDEAMLRLENRKQRGCRGM